MFLMGSTLSDWELVSQNVKECGGYLNQRDLPNKNNYYLVAQSTCPHKNVPELITNIKSANPFQVQEFF